MQFIKKPCFHDKFQVVLVVFAGFLGAAGAGCGNKSGSNAAAAGGGPMPVQVQVAEVKKIPDTSQFLSVLKSRHSSAINPQVEGQIVKIFVKSGDHVKLGEPLLQIDPLKQEATVSSQEAARAAQEANKKYAQISLERAKKLYDAGVISKAEYDNAQTAYDAADAQLRALEEQVRTQRVELKYYQVSSPMDGIVGDIPVHVGDRVSFSTLLTTVDEPGELEAYIYVPADRAKALKMGLPVRLLDDAGNAVSDTHITFISTQVDTDTQTVLAKAAVANARSSLRISQQVRAQVSWSSHEGTVVPVLAVTRINGQSFVFVAMNEGKGAVARQRLLRLGDTVGNDFAVLDGLKPGDHVIVSGTQFLQDGAAVAEQIQSDAKPGDAKTTTTR